ncbi:sugar transferase [Candidatus Shapirobacteria bacterium]|nr:sugar transferase [Candidatus Shapirobacteria bacterium]
MGNNQKVPLYKLRVFLFKPIKRTIDIFSSLILLIIFSPIMLIVSLIIKLTSPGPVIFKQKRVGQNREFFMYKFRSMRIGDNDKYLKENYPKLWEKYKANDWKLSTSEDPRVTPIGKFIRNTSIDEMPQFINVLKGEMSLVGPRAYRDAELDEYSKKYPHTKKYINDIRSVKPGITGPWQVSGRNELPFEKRSQMDSEYIKRRSIRQEILIILKTPFAMISRW